MPKVFMAKEGSRFAPGPMLALVEKEGMLSVITPRAGMRAAVQILEIAVVLLPLLAAIPAAVLVAKTLRADPIIALFLVFLAWILGLAALQGRIWSRMSHYLAREPAATVPLVVKAVGPTRHLRIHEVRGVAGNREVVLSVYGDWRELTQALAVGGFTATKQRKHA